MLTPEYEDPDRDASEQADARYQPPPTLDGAEDVLSAQGSSSASDAATAHRPVPTAVPAEPARRGKLGFPSESRILPSVIAEQSGFRGADGPVWVLSLINGQLASCTPPRLWRSRIVVVGQRVRCNNAVEPTSWSERPTNP